MLTRQKIVLGLLLNHARPLSPTAFVKLMFLLGRETRVGRSCPYYEFVPYKFGPFSFTLYRELGALRRDGYAAPDDKRVALNPETRELARAKADELPRWAREAIAEVDGKYGRLSPDDLIRDVYARYPWYASRSELTKTRPAPPMARPGVYTIGYQGRTLDGLLDTLLQAGIAGILDVRANPVSRRYGFARKTLSEAAARVGLEYAHSPEFGIPGELRKDLGTRESYDRLLDHYEREMLPGRAREIEQVIPKLRQKPTALLCQEGDSSCCHRGRLAKAVSKASGLSVEHL